MRTCFLLAAAITGLGLALRLAMPVTPVDDPFRDVLRAYANTGSNTGETRAP
ncbi:hypothetical protein Q8W71_03260 [Methylobacterium sp. NEAU 140]|uniref:hypothetical protein n=1 Tax=Methylobacterium sp. NEAU 140 TaxID=3064945 RepID=UPI0027359CC0|nr:hypothetical protein [Methylobacterium sp. NEAU 140]MDP4021631.1 hypothetical protein [Methylobacterium sp. NEAU 140]